MVFSIFKSFTSFLFFLVLIQKPILFWFLFPSWTYPPIPSFLFPCFIYSFKTKKNLRFLSSQWTVTLPSQALPENRLGIAHAITEIGKDTLIIWNTFVEWSSTKVDSKPSLFYIISVQILHTKSHYLCPQSNFWRRCRGEQRFFL